MTNKIKQMNRWIKIFNAKPSTGHWQTTQMNSNGTPTEQREGEVFTRTTSISPTTPSMRETALLQHTTQPQAGLYTPDTPSCRDGYIHVVRQCDKDQEETVTALKLFVIVTYMGPI